MRQPGKDQKGMQEKRWKIQLEAADLTGLQKLLDKHHFSTLKIKERKGVPDESKTTIEIKYESGSKQLAWRWFKDKHEDFDPIYYRLLTFVLRARKNEPEYQGNIQQKWKPEGF